MLCLIFFAFTTILGWSYYSERCLTYLRGKASHTLTLAFRWLYIVAVFIGPYLTVEAVWDTADVFNGLMAFPNVIALIALSGNGYQTILRRKAASAAVTAESYTNLKQITGREQKLLSCFFVKIQWKCWTTAPEYAIITKVYFRQHPQVLRSAAFQKRVGVFLQKW